MASFGEELDGIDYCGRRGAKASCGQKMNAKTCTMAIVHPLARRPYRLALTP